MSSLPVRTALILLGVVACAVTVNAVVAAAALHAGASESFQPLQFPVYGALSAVGVVAGWFGWRAVQRRSARPRALLMLLVPAVILVSFVPDLALLALRFIPNSNPTAVTALMVMHVVVAAFAVPGYAIAAPLPAGAVTTRQPASTG